MKNLLLLLLLTACTPDMATLTLVNNEVNSYKYTSERKNVWKTPEQFYKDKGGDCEDFAIAKCASLKERGIRSVVVVGYDKITYEQHAVLVVGDYVLDNNKKDVYAIEDFETKYFILAQIKNCMGEQWATQ